MGTLLAVLVIIQTVITSVFSQQMADEFKAWTPWLTRRLIDRSVVKLPAELRERYREEWSSHVQEVPGEVGKLFVAAGFLRAASAMREIDRAPEHSPSSAIGTFGLLPEPEGRWGTFGISLLTNVLIVILLIFGTVAIRPR
jgi:hypothetical protein